jgi:hypothetical protein
LTIKIVDRTGAEITQYEGDPEKIARDLMEHGTELKTIRQTKTEYVWEAR